MNYEGFYDEIQPIEKAMKDKLAALQRVLKAVTKDTDNGDVKSMKKNLDLMGELAAAFLETLQSAKEETESFDGKTYFESGEFAGQMIEICKENAVDVRGEFPVYEMFPYRVKIDVENQDVFLDRKKVQCMRPKKFVETVRAGQEKLKKASFNELVFAGELAEAYDTAVLKLKKRPEQDIYLTSLYKYLAPMGRFRKEYDQQSFAFDLARLYICGLEETKNGRRFQFGPSRDQNKAIRILDRDGKEQFLATIRFFQG